LEVRGNTRKKATSNQHDSKLFYKSMEQVEEATRAIRQLHEGGPSVAGVATSLKLLPRCRLRTASKFRRLDLFCSLAGMTLMQHQIGVIGLPIIGCDDGPSSDYSYSTRMFISYTEYAKQHPLGQQKLSQLALDERCIRLQEQFKAVNYSPYENERIAGWWLMRANQVGSTAADADLDRYLNEELVDRIVVTSVYGVEPKATYQLLDGVELVPLSEMQNCDTKEDVLRRRWRPATNVQPMYSGALMSTIRVRRVPDASEPFEQSARDASKLHHEVAILLNCLSGICCATGYQTSLVPDHVPVGAMSGSGGGFPIRDVFPLRVLVA
jgi:hypothetical protein